MELQFKNVRTVLAKRHTRVFRAVKRDDVPEYRPEQPETVRVEAADHTLTLARNPAVYSDGQLDPATALLCSSLPAIEGHLLDFGSGSGLVSAVLARLSQNSKITAIDSNLEAVSTTRETLQLNGMSGVDVRASYFGEDLPDREFDLIACYPPFHVGPTVAHEVGRRMLSEAARMLKPGGKFYVALSQAQGYEGALHKLFGRVLPVVSTPRYRVLVAERPR